MNDDVNHMAIPLRGYEMDSSLHIFLQEEQYIIKYEIKSQYSLKLAVPP